MMTRALTVLAGLLVAGSLAAANPRPNIVVILADDLGYETIGANGGQSYATPRLDSLAASGIRFRQRLRPAALHPHARAAHDREVQRPQLRRVRDPARRDR